MTIFYHICVGIFVLGLLVVVHELGHFLVAKMFKVGVLEFSIGFGKKLLQKRIHGTRYAIAAIPLGGYVRMVGDDLRRKFGEEIKEDEKGKTSPDNILQDVEQCDDEEVKAMLAKKGCWFLERGFFTKIAIVLAGPFFNFLFAFLVLLGVYYFKGIQEPVDEPVIGTVIEEADFPAYKAGLKELDRILEINGQPVATWKDAAGIIRNSGGSQINFVIEREADGEKQIKNISVTPVLETMNADGTVKDPSGKPEYIVGIAVNTKYTSVPFFRAVRESAVSVSGLSVSILKGVWQLVRGKMSARSLGGPIAIVKQAGKSAEHGTGSLCYFIVFLSISLGILNLLPIPVLDGGHILLFTIGIFKKGLHYIGLAKNDALSIETQELANMIGFSFLIFLMLFAFSNDIRRLFE